ncbi:MAG TPA: DNA methyltransferase [Alphaproteobacteria bacterium]|nr:DNA methyltransferase [Alphaproteobacteria bacterium]
MQNTVQAKPIAPYLGGKSKLAKTICSIIDNTEHKTYAEPFVGMGGILFRKEKPAKAEIINDYNYEVFTLFRVLQRHYDEFLNQLEYINHSRNHFKYLKDLNPTHLTDIERAARFYYLLRASFGAMASTYGVDKTRPDRFNINKYKKDLAHTVNRLRSVAMENLDFEDFIKKYDSKDTLFYLDPPYYGCENDYGKELFRREDFERIRSTLDSIQGKFILSLNDLPPVREIFKGYYIKEVELLYTVAKNGNKKAKEVIISNYPLD